VADWGVDEHVFDRMPSRRFGRRGETPARRSGDAERFVRRRAEAESWDDSAGWEEPRRDKDPGWDDQFAARDELVRSDDGASRDDFAGRRETARRDDFAGWDEPSGRDDLAGRRETARRDDFAAWDEPSGGDDLAGSDDDLTARAAGDGRRTIVVGGAVEGEIPPPDVETPRERRTVVIGGRPDGVPYVRPQRPSRTAAERVGARPDRFVAYAVALGFLLILIAVLSTGH
jgi:hypothetical protein